MMKVAPFLTVLCMCVLAGCVSDSNNRFNSDKVSLKQASQDNVNLGVQYLQKGYRDLAMEKIQKALQLDPDNADAYSAEALIYDSIADTERADKAYQIALRKAADNPEIQNNYAVFLCKHGKPAQSVKYFLTAAINPMYHTPEVAYVNAGVCSGYIPDLPGAEQYFRKSLAINPGYPLALYQMAQVSYAEKKFLQARAFIERYNAASPQPQPDVLLLGTRIERALGSQQTAAEYARQLRKLFPSSPQAQQLDQVDGHAGSGG